MNEIKKLLYIFNFEGTSKEYILDYYGLNSPNTPFLTVSLENGIIKYFENATDDYKHIYNLTPENLLNEINKYIDEAGRTEK